jgi:hypothetical protein
MFAGQHNQIHATTPCTAWARAAHVFSIFGPPPSIFLSERKSVFMPKRFCRTCLSRNESHAKKPCESTGWCGYCFGSYALSAGNVRSGAQASSAVQRYRLWAQPIDEDWDDLVTCTRPAFLRSLCCRFPCDLFEAPRLLDGRFTRKRCARFTGGDIFLGNRRSASAYSGSKLPCHLFYSQLGTLRLLDGRCARKRFARLTS